ncbi:ArgS-related anticodon-binding protein NrtL [Streptomyces sp. BK205]|uniref:ArgS-related anticodon-binding protein NrtL n=1 Tax=Streptomyces sp. BK205 TaxID=2512164 RepID=UPI0010434E54|nr:DALR anticodon-binding domain-containing protein [Streptomyces sp. BK205]TCR15430.1 arginyl-tRNA synthetase [Streptomyces sp. BK205]
MTPVELSRTVLRAVRCAVDEGELDVGVPAAVKVTPPGPGGCGDYATNLALQLAGPAGQPPLRVAEILRTRLLQSDGIGDVVVTGPGFLNISLQGEGSQAALVREILEAGERYGHVERPTGQLVQLHAPHEVRAVVVMDALARVLRSQGALVRTSCASRPEPEWAQVLGAHVDAHGSLEAPVRRDAYGTPEVPAPVDAHGTPEAPAPVDAHGPQGAPTRPGTPDAHGTPTPLHLTLRPVPATPDPTPLGRDAARWALLHPAAHDRPRITANHLVQRESNPLFRVRYAHARTRALSRNAADLGFHAEPGPLETPAPGTPARDTSARDTPARDIAVRPSAVQHPPTPLLTALAAHPRTLQAVAAHHAPDRLARHLVTVADAALPFLLTVLPRGAEKPSAAHRARLALAEAVGAVLAGGLSLLGIDAPEHL